jgi:ABC-2 type transport system ATP-binding protein
MIGVPASLHNARPDLARLPLMPDIISIDRVSKTYASGFHALDDVSLDIRGGEIFALLGPNGAGKTTLIGIVCGLVKLTQGNVKVAGLDIRADYRKVRAMIGLVPQELTTDAFESVWATVSFSRGLFGKRANPAYVEKTLKDLSLWDKKDNKIMTLSGGMKRRVMIAKALAHEPRVLFLDEPTAGVDVALRQEMWQLVRGLRASGVTIVLTTHYIDEAEDMADRVGIIRQGKIILVEDKATLMRKLGKKRLMLQIEPPLTQLPPRLAAISGLTLASGGTELNYVYDPGGTKDAVPVLLEALRGALPEAGVRVKDLETAQSSLEDIFVNLVRE